ncbi:MAG: hypothetical protein NC898_02970 [Candidatus Omnitrophica bacterium]|nr:hypothetical protein [Candidatus Omnitrophota bacterium]MCM8793412.1 hypothetical protein [Candidatus Omnitrophota bacterium]
MKRFNPSFEIFSPMVISGEMVDYGRTPPPMQEKIKNERERVKTVIKDLGYRVKKAVEGWPRNRHLLLSGETFFEDFEDKSHGMLKDIGGNLVWSERERFLIISVAKDRYRGLTSELKEEIKGFLDGKLKIYELPPPP